MASDATDCGRVVMARQTWKPLLSTKNTKGHERIRLSIQFGRLPPQVMRSNLIRQLIYFVALVFFVDEFFRVIQIAIYPL
jgi:hypothetical protein